MTTELDLRNRQKTSASRKWPIRLMWIGVFVTLVPFLLLLFMALPDQTRALKKPEIAYRNFLAESSRRLKKDNFVKPVEASNESAKSNLNSNMTSDCVGLKIESKKIDMPPFFTDSLTSMTPEFRQMAEELNRTTRELSERFIAYPATIDGLAYEQADKSLRLLQKEIHPVFKKGVQIQRGPKGSNPATPSKIVYPADNPNSIVDLFYLSSFAELSLYDHYEQYDLAAKICRNIQGNFPHKDSFLWQLEIYYSRRSGIRGRLQLAVRSTSSLLVPLDYWTNKYKPQFVRNMEKNYPLF